jgi:hypothetical protein
VDEALLLAEVGTYLPKYTASHPAFYVRHCDDVNLIKCGGILNSR